MSVGADARARLAALGLTLPPVAAPVASYVPAVRIGDTVQTSGQLPTVGGELVHTGRVGAEVTVEQGAEAARVAILNALAAVDALIGLEGIGQVAKVTGFVSSAPGFHSQPAVINGASDLLGELFGEAGRHARSAVGVPDLPVNAPVEIELLVTVA